MDRETYIVSARERELEAMIAELRDEKAWLLRRHRCCDLLLGSRWILTVKNQCSFVSIEHFTSI